MTRVKRGTLSVRKRKKILKHTKGFKWGRKSKVRAAKEAVLHAWTHAFAGRKQKKRDFRTLWNVRINAASRELGVKYSDLINKLKKADIKLDRKILADFARNNPEIFTKIVEKVK
ncbi:50S ribosomal protein L20 [Patescibacteria group bacterium]|nr:50S ribosomal protein L20 [Patescibacteria group bacterium]